MESELLDKLRLFLDLEWTTGVLLPPMVQPALQPLGDVPAEAASEMLRLARLGYVQGIREVIDGLIAQDPRMRRACAPLKALLDRFDLDSFIELLKEKSYAYDS
jgi:hypothetical protein